MPLIDWERGIGADAALKAASIIGGSVVVCVGFLLTNQAMNSAQDAKIARLDDRVGVVEKAADKWQNEEKDRLNAINQSVDRLVDKVNEVKIDVAKISAQTSPIKR